MGNLHSAITYGDVGISDLPQTIELAIEKSSQGARPIGSTSTSENTVPRHKVLQDVQTLLRVVNPSNFRAKEIIKQKWLGTVIDFDGDKITAILEDKTDSSNPKEEVVFSIEEIDDFDHSLIERGAVFYWHIGYRQGPTKGRERFSKIRFRRLPAWSENDVEAARREALELEAFFSAD